MISTNRLNLLNFVARLRLLATGRGEWVDVRTGDVEVLRHRWALAGVHSRNWWWVQRYGRRDCGCVINPLTRRRVGIALGCRQHCSLATEEQP